MKIIVASKLIVKTTMSWIYDDIFLNDYEILQQISPVLRKIILFKVYVNNPLCRILSSSHRSCI